jgi:hypothetical protein
MRRRGDAREQQRDRVMPMELAFAKKEELAQVHALGDDAQQADNHHLAGPARTRVRRAKWKLS